MRTPEATDHYGGPSLSEAQLRARVVELAHAAGWRVFSLPIARPVRPVKDALGYPDLTLSRHGEVLWLELKTEDGKLREEQKLWLASLPAHRCYVIRPSDVTTHRLGRILATGSSDLVDTAEWSLYIDGPLG